MKRVALLLLALLLTPATGPASAATGNVVDMALAIAEQQASTPSYMTANPKWSYEVFVTTDDGRALRVPLAALSRFAATGIQFVEPRNDRARSKLDLARLNVMGPRRRSDGDFDVMFYYSACLKGRGAYGQGNTALMRLVNGSWQVLSVREDGSFQGQCT